MSLQDRREHMERCTRCSQCKWVPIPASKQFSSICPSIEYGNFHAYSGGGKNITAYAMLENKASYSGDLVRSVYACTMCGACDTTCKFLQGENVDLLSNLYELRARIASDGQAPKVYDDLRKQLREEGTFLGKRHERSRWAQGLSIKDITRRPADVFLHVGCDNAYDASRWRELTFIVSLLDKAGIDFGIAFDAEVNSGGVAFDLGFQEDARQLAEQTLALFRASKARTIVTCSADSYATFRNIYPRLGLSIEADILHVTQFVSSLVKEGRLKIDARSSETLTYHDACRLGRLSEPFEPWNGSRIKVLEQLSVQDPPQRVRFGVGGHYEVPRDLLAQIRGAEIVEMERNREYSYCCGAGGAASKAYPEFAQMAAASRLDEAVAAGATTLVSASSTCTSHLATVAEQRNMPLKVKGLFELLADLTGEMSS